MADTPRWVKVLGIHAVVVVLLVVALMVTDIGGEHGPGRHAPSGDPAGQEPPAGVPEGHTPPPGVDHGPPP